MSEPVTNVEIEDVLESIRLLIAADDPAAPVPSRRAQQRQDRLVLTPALRVDAAPEHHDEGSTGTVTEDHAPVEEASDLPGPEPEAPAAGYDTRADLSWGDTNHFVFRDNGSNEVAEETEPGEPEPGEPEPAEPELAETEAEPEEAMADPLAPAARSPEQSKRIDPPKEETADPALDWEDVDATGSGPGQWHPEPSAAQDEVDEEEIAFADEEHEFSDDDWDIPATGQEPDDAEEEETVAVWHSTRSAAEAPDETVAETPERPEEPEPRHEDTRRSSLEATIAELEAAVTFSSQDFEADDPDTGLAAHSSGRLHLVVTGDLDPEEDFEPQTPPAPETGAAAPAETETPATTTETGAATPEEDPAAGPEPSDAPSPSASGPRFRVYPGSAPPRDPEPAPAPQDGHIAARPDLDDDADLAAYLEDESVIDEEALRDLVGQIVREELQGVLGERITRNVRKLVRREIHRILSSQDFD